MGSKPAPDRHPGSPRFTSATLNMLKFIYGDLTPTRISELKAACRHEVCVIDLCDDCYQYHGISDTCPAWSYILVSLTPDSNDIHTITFTGSLILEHYFYDEKSTLYENWNQWCIYSVVN